jgi:hypothetical protein
MLRAGYRCDLEPQSRFTCVKTDQSQVIVTCVRRIHLAFRREGPRSVLIGAYVQKPACTGL